MTVHRSAVVHAATTATVAVNPVVTAFIGLGANINDPERQIITALEALHQLPHTRLRQWSSLYGSKPLGPQDQPDYRNAVAEIETSLSAAELLALLQQQERNQGREKLRHWGERCIDLDILLFGHEVIETPDLTVPHAGLTERSFVVRPLLEIAPDLILPDGRSLQQIVPAFDGGLMQLQRPLIDL